MNNIKHLLVILAVCCTIIENIGGFPLYITIAYVGISGIDFLRGWRNRIFKGGNDIVYLWMLLFLYLTLVTAYLSLKTSSTDMTISLKWMKALVLFVLILKDTYRNPKLQFAIIICYSVFAIVCSFLMLNGYGVNYDLFEIGEFRLTFFGTNANKMAMVYVYTFCFLLYMIELTAKKGVFLNLIVKVLCISSIILCLYMIANMASRGAVAGILIVVVYYFFFYKQSHSLIKNVFFVTMGIILITYGYDFIYDIDIFSSRMDLMREGNYGQRDILLKAAFSIFVKNPFWGIGLYNVPLEIANVIGVPKTPHNLLLYILASGGVVGGAIFVSLMVKYIKFIYRFGHRAQHLMPVLLLLCVFVDFSKNGSALTTSINYIFFALSMTMCVDKDEKREIKTI